LYRIVYVLDTQYIYTPKVPMATSVKVRHYVEWDCQSSDPQEIHCFKWEFCF